MTALPSVSVCIPVYCGEPFLEEAISSVLDQTYRDFELVILDNASTDRTADIASSFDDPRVRIVTNPSTLAQPQNWRRAVELCRAPLVKLLCADDLLHPRCLEYQVAAMDADPGLAVVAARRHMIDESTRVLVPRRGLRGLIGVRSATQVARTVVRSGVNPIGEPGGVLFRQADYVAVGGWRADRQWAMDLDLWLRLLQCGEFCGLPQTLAAFRAGGHSLSAENEAGIYDTQRTIMNEVAATPQFRVRRSDLLLGRLRAPAGRLRRRMLFWMAAGAHRRDRRLPHETSSLSARRAEDRFSGRPSDDRPGRAVPATFGPVVPPQLSVPSQGNSACRPPSGRQGGAVGGV